MKKPAQVALIVEGNSTRSTIIRLPRLADEIGPVKATTLRVARRVSNFLKAGYPVSTYEDLQPAKMVLMRLPDESVKRVVNEISGSALVCKDMTFVLCESWLPSSVLEPLTRLGANVATTVGVPSTNSDWFVVEGQYAATRQMRRLLEEHNTRVIELRHATKHLYFAAGILVNALPLPLLLAARQCMTTAGISGPHLYSLFEELLQDIFRSFAKGARAPWGGPLTECNETVANAHLEDLRRTEPEVAEFLEEQLRLAARMMIRQKLDS